MENVKEIVDKVLRAGVGKPYQRKVGVYYPSEAYKCPRKVFYDFTDPAPPGDAPIGLFKMGKAAEDQLFEVLKQHYGEALHDQQRVILEYDDFVVRGYSDFTLHDPDGKVKYVFEIKSTKDLSRHRRLDIAHKAQLHCYLAAFKCFNGALVYIERGDIQKVKQYPMVFDIDFYDAIVNNFKIIHQSLVDHEIPPPKPCDQVECRWCSYRDRCMSHKSSGVSGVSVGKLRDIMRSRVAGQ